MTIEFTIPTRLKTEAEHLAQQMRRAAAVLGLNDPKFLVPYSGDQANLRTVYDRHFDNGQPVSPSVRLSERVAVGLAGVADKELWEFDHRLKSDPARARRSTRIQKVLRGRYIDRSHFSRSWHFRTIEVPKGGPSTYPKNRRIKDLRDHLDDRGVTSSCLLDVHLLWAAIPKIISANGKFLPERQALGLITGLIRYFDVIAGRRSLDSLALLTRWGIGRASKIGALLDLEELLHFANQLLNDATSFGKWQLGMAHGIISADRGLVHTRDLEAVSLALASVSPSSITSVSSEFVDQMGPAAIFNATWLQIRAGTPAIAPSAIFRDTRFANRTQIDMLRECVEVSFKRETPCAPYIAQSLAHLMLEQGSKLQKDAESLALDGLAFCQNGWDEGNNPAAPMLLGAVKLRLERRRGQTSRALRKRYAKMLMKSGHADIARSLTDTGSR